MRAPADTRGRLTQVDALKGFAMIGVMIQHAFVPDALHNAWDILWADQAVPVFFVVMGLNAAGSASRHGARTLRQLYDGRYWASRFDRLVVPFLVIWPIALLAGLATGTFHLGPLAIIGVYPLTASPGNYFITIMLEFAVLFPAVWWCFSRRPAVTSIALVVIDVAFELAAGHTSFFVHSSGAAYLYAAAIPKYAVFIVAGMWLARVHLARREWLTILILAAVGVVYLVALHQRPDDFNWLVPSFSRSTNFISCFYGVLITVLGLRFIPGEDRRRLPGWARVERLGRASYHIFLVQILWFGLVTNRTVAVGIIGIVASLILGVAFSEVPLPSVGRRRRRDVAPSQAPAVTAALTARVPGSG